jgi:hypothetical protein
MAITLLGMSGFFFTYCTALGEWARLREKVGVTCAPVLLRQELIVGRVVDIVAFIAIEGHYEGSMRIEEVPKDSVLSPAGIRESYHICVITDVAGRIWLVPAGLRKLL